MTIFFSFVFIGMMGIVRVGLAYQYHGREGGSVASNPAGMNGK